jgi:hypothetical protein
MCGRETDMNILLMISAFCFAASTGLSVSRGHYGWAAFTALIGIYAAIWSIEK